MQKSTDFISFSYHFSLVLYNKKFYSIGDSSQSLFSSLSFFNIIPPGFHLHDIMKILLARCPQPPPSQFKCQFSVLMSPDISAAFRAVDQHLQLQTFSPLALGAPLLVSPQAATCQSLCWFFLISLTSKCLCALRFRPQTSSNLIQPPWLQLQSVY